MFKEKKGDDTGMQTNVWGPAGWVFLHSIAQNYPWKPTHEQMEYYYNFFKVIGNVLPCRYCRESYQQFIEEPGTQLSLKTMKNRKSIVTWLYKIHNKVNRKLDIKSNPTLKEVWDKYESFRSKCHKTPVVKKGCTVPMNGHRKKCVIKIEDIDEDIAEETENEFGKKIVQKPKYTEQEIMHALSVLNINDKNNVREIKKAYHKLSLIYHPDRPSGNENKFKEINNAYSILMDINGMKFGKSVARKKSKSKLLLISVKKSNKKGKKFMATFEKGGRRKVIHFGASGMRDFTIMGHNKDRMRLYRQRHMKDLKTGNPTRAGFLSMYILWNKPSLQASISNYRRRLNVYNRTGKFPTKF